MRKRIDAILSTLNSHAVSCSQISVNKLEVCEVGHAFSDLYAIVHQVLHSRILKRDNSSYIYLCTRKKNWQFYLRELSVNLYTEMNLGTVPLMDVFVFDNYIFMNIQMFLTKYVLRTRVTIAALWQKIKQAIHK